MSSDHGRAKLGEGSASNDEALVATLPKPKHPAHGDSHSLLGAGQLITNIRAGDRTLKGAELLKRAGHAAGASAELGVGEGDVMATFLRNGCAMLEAILAARLAGCFLCPINWHLKADEVGYLLRDSGAAAVVLHADLLPVLAGIVPADVHVIVVEPEAPLRAAFGIADEAARAPPGMREWERWLAASPPLAGPPRIP